MTAKHHTHPTTVYELVTDPDPENGLQIRGHTLRMNEHEINTGLQLRIFTPHTILRRRDQLYQVVTIEGHQSLAILSG